MAGEELRLDLIVRVEQSLVAVRELVSQMNDGEKKHMQNNSVAYRQLVDTIKHFYSLT